MPSHSPVLCVVQKLTKSVTSSHSSHRLHNSHSWHKEPGRPGNVSIVHSAAAMVHKRSHMTRQKVFQRAASKKRCKRLSTRALPARASGGPRTHGQHAEPQSGAPGAPFTLRLSDDELRRQGGDDRLRRVLALAQADDDPVELERVVRVREAGALEHLSKTKEGGGREGIYACQEREGKEEDVCPEPRENTPRRCVSRAGST